MASNVSMGLNLSSWLSQVGQHVTVVSGGYSEYAITKPALCYPVRQASAEAVAVSLSGLTAAAALLVSPRLPNTETPMSFSKRQSQWHERDLQFSANCKK